MFLIRWCMDAISCRRMTLEAMPLSPAKYSDVTGQSAIDSDVTGLHRQLGYDVTGIRRALLDAGDPVDPPSFFQERLYAVYSQMPGECSAALSNGPAESRDSCDVTASTCLRLPSHLSDSLSRDLSASTGRNGKCACQHDTGVTVKENICPNPDDTNSPLITKSEQQLQIETSRQLECLYTDSSSISTASRDCQFADDFDSTRTCLLACTVADGTSSVSRQSGADSFPLDMQSYFIAAAARSLVEHSIRAAVTAIRDSVNVPPSSVSNSCVSPLASDSESRSPEAIANQLIDQLLSEVVRINGISMSASSAVLPDGTPTCTASLSAPFSHSCVVSNHSADDDAAKSEGCKGGVTLTSDAAALSAGSSCPDSEPEQVLAFYAQTRLSYYCDCQSVDDVDHQLQSISASLSSSRLTFNEEISPPPSRNVNPLGDVTDVLNNNNLAAERFDEACNYRSTSDSDSSQSHHRHADSDVMTRPWSSADGHSDPSTSNDRYDSALSFAGHDILIGEEASVEVRSSTNQFMSEHADDERWNFFEPGYRTEDYFFRHYIIPVDQLEREQAMVSTSNGMMTSAVDTGRQQVCTGIQLKLQTNEETCSGADFDAEVEAVAAFCRAVFTPIADDLDEALSPSSTPDVVSSPETPDVEERCGAGSRPPGVRRCISLRTSPGVPSHKKKSVRFADALGLDLVCVRQIQNVEESMPFGSFVDILPRRPPLCEAAAVWRQYRPPGRSYLCACFQAPGGHPDFIERVRHLRVALETCGIDNGSSTINGVVRVANVAYRKTVAARVTTDAWASQTDVAADYVPRSNDGTTDRFSFQVVLPRGATELGRRVEVAVCFTAFFDDHRSETYWDNNFGANYSFECYGGGGSGVNDDGGTGLSDSETDDEFSAWMSFA